MKYCLEKLIVHSILPGETMYLNITVQYALPEKKARKKQLEHDCLFLEKLFEHEICTAWRLSRETIELEIQHFLEDLI
jgi:hypothetical protein